MQRWIALGLAIVLSACSGGARMLPGTPSAVQGDAGRRHHRVRVYVRMRIPRRPRRGERVPVHPATISPLTQSVGIAVNGGAANVFNTTRASSNCSATAGGTLCTFGVDAPAGSDTFVVTTYDAANAGGTILDRGAAVVDVVAGKANSFSITLGPVVSTTADGGVGSLRYAVANASPGDTIVFVLPQNSTIVLSSVITPPVSLSIAGPGVTASLRPHANRRGIHSNTTYGGIIVDGGNTEQIFSIGSGLTVAISGLVLDQGAAFASGRPGGAIGNYGALTLADDAIVDGISTAMLGVRPNPFARMRFLGPLARLRARDRSRPHCTATDEYGGGAYNAGSLVVIDSTFDGNAVSDLCGNHGYGGAIYNDATGTLAVTGSTFTNNAGEFGGAIFNNSSAGQPTFDDDTFTANTGCTAVTGCAPTGCNGNGCSNFPHGFGAAIYDYGKLGIIVTNSTFSNNVAGGKESGSFGGGGALFLLGYSQTVTGDTFTGNVSGGGIDNCSSGQGGAISDVGTMELDDDVFTNNEAGGDDNGHGGAVIAGYVSGSNDTFDNNTAIGGGSTCSGALGVADGGAMISNGGTLSASTFSGNVASANESADGGAIEADGATSIIDDTFSSNTAIANGADGAPSPHAAGGAIDALSALRLVGDTFTSNSASIGSSAANTAVGGAVATVSGTSLVSSKSIFTSNVATSTAGGGSVTSGGAVYAGTFASNGDTFTNNSASGLNDVSGGALVVTKATIRNATFSGNTAIGSGALAAGGAIFNAGVSSISASTLTGNSAKATFYGLGGAIIDQGGLTIDGSTVSNNTATSGGGGILTIAAETIADSTFEGNAVTSAPGAFGGGALMLDGLVTISDSSISGNSVTVAGNNAGGGAIYNAGGLELLSSTLSANSVTGSGTADGGGGIFNQESATLINDTIAGNTSNEDGGGIETYDPSNQYVESLVNVTLYQNSAIGNGGNIYNPSVGSTPYEILLYNSIVAGGNAGTGPDINDTGGKMASEDYNIIGSAGPYGGTFALAPHDKPATDPQLLPLANNGGPTFTYADQATSPGTGMIPYFAGNCGAAMDPVDQRGYSRGTGGVCDAGAFEFGGVATAIELRPPKLHALPPRTRVPHLQLPIVHPPSR